MNPTLYLDSGASTHTTNDPGMLYIPKPHYKTNKVIVGNGQLLPISLVDSYSINKLNGSLRLSNILHDVDLSWNLMSVKQLYKDDSCVVYFGDTSFIMKKNMTSRFSFSLDILCPRYIRLTIPLSRSTCPHWLPLSHLCFVGIIISVIHILMPSQVLLVNKDFAIQAAWLCLLKSRKVA